jgi:hypothetical protein
LIADEEHLCMAGFGKAVWSKFGEFHHRQQWRFNINLWNRPRAAIEIVSRSEWWQDK